MRFISTRELKKRRFSEHFRIFFFRTSHPLLAVYAVVTDVQGTTPFGIRIVDVDDEHVLAEITAEVTSTDPRAVYEMPISFQGLEFPRPGEYRIQFTAFGDLLLERRILLIDVRASGA